MYSECIGETSGSDSKYVLNSGTEPVILFRLGFVLRLGSVTTSFYNRNWDGFLFLFAVFKYVS